MISAEEAKEKVTKGKYNKAKKQLSMVEIAINKSIENGLYYCCGGEYLEESVINELTNKGYDANTDYGERGDYWTVSWK